MDLTIDTLHLKRSLGPWLRCYSPFFLLSSRIIMVCNSSPTMTKYHFLVLVYGTKWLLCADVPLKPHSLTSELFVNDRL